MSNDQPLALIIEDVSEVAEIIKLYLQRLKVDSVLAPDVDKALHRVQERVPDVILLDIGMPNVTGWDFLRQIRQEDGPLYDVPVIVVTAYTDPDSQNTGHAMNVDAYLKKPIEFHQIKAAIEDLFGPR